MAALPSSVIFCGPPWRRLAFVKNRGSGLLVPLLGEQKSNGLAGLGYRAVERVPLAFPLHVRLVQAPTDPHRALAGDETPLPTADCL